MPQTLPRIDLLNATCFDVLDEDPHFLDEFAGQARITTDPAVKQMDEAQLDRFITGADAIIINAAKLGFPREAVMRNHPELKVLSLAAAGYDWLELEAATRLGIVATNAPIESGAEVVADMAFGLMLAACRQIPQHHAAIAAGRKMRGYGHSVWGKTLGIVGFGRIGKTMVKRARGFEMRVIATGRTMNVPDAAALGVEMMPLENLLRQADFVSLHMPLNEQTRSIISAERIGLMKRTAYLINAARRELVDEAALAEALVAGRIAGAGLDEAPRQRDERLFALPGYVTTTHLGNRAIEGMRDVFRQAVVNAIDILNRRDCPYILNPSVCRKS